MLKKSLYSQGAPLRWASFNDPDYDPFVLGVPPLMVAEFAMALVEAGEPIKSACEMATTLRSLFLKRHILMAHN